MSSQSDRSTVPGTWRNLLQRVSFSRDALTGGAAVLTAGTVAAQGCNFLAAPVLARLYGAQDFGNFAVVTTVLAFGLAIVAGRYELAILLPDSDLEAAALVAAALVCVGITTIGYGSLLVLFGAVGILPESCRTAQGYLWAVPISMLAGGSYLVMSHWAIRRLWYTRIAATKLSQGLGQLLSQIGVALLFGPGGPGLVVGDVVGRSCGVLGLSSAAWAADKSLFRTLTWRQVITSLARYRDFPLLAAGSNLVNALGLGVPVLAIGAFYGPAVLGSFALIDRLLNAPCALIGQALAQVYNGHMPRVHRASRRAALTLYWRRLRQLALFGIVPFSILWWLAPWMAVHGLGPQWKEAGYYARLLIPMNFVAFFVWPLTSTLNLIERQVWQLAWDIGRLALCGCGFLFVRSANGSPRAAVAAYSVCMSIAYISHIFLSTAALRRESPKRAPNACRRVR